MKTYKAMWKRIQTLYLAVVVLLLGTMPFLKICHGYDAVARADVSIRFYEHPVFLLFICIAFVLCGIALFAFRKRMLQIRMCAAASFILLCLQIWIIIAFFVQLGGSFIISPATLIPIPCMALLILSIKKIGKDEVQYAKDLLAGKYKESGADKK